MFCGFLVLVLPSYFVPSLNWSGRLCFCWAMLLGQSVPLLLTCLTAENSEVPRSYRPTQDHVTAGWLGLTLLVVVLPAALGSGGALHRHSRHSQLSLHYTTGQGLSRGCPFFSLFPPPRPHPIQCRYSSRETWYCGTLVALLWRVSCGRAWGLLVTLSVALSWLV